MSGIGGKRAPELARQDGLKIVKYEHEKEVVEAVMAGHTHRYRDLVELHQDRLFGFLLKQTGQYDLAQELAQDAFVKAYRSLSSFRFDCAFGTWLTQIALNLSRSYLRSKQYQSLKQQAPLESIAPSALSELPDADFKIILERAINSLEPHYKEVLILCRMQGHSYEEVAEILDIPIGTVRSRLNQARLLLKQLLCQEEAHE